MSLKEIKITRDLTELEDELCAALEIIQSDLAEIKTDEDHPLDFPIRQMETTIREAIAKARGAES